MASKTEIVRRELPDGQVIIITGEMFQRIAEARRARLAIQEGGSPVTIDTNRERRVGRSFSESADPAAIVSSSTRSPRMI